MRQTDAQTDAILSARRAKAQAKRADSTPQVSLPQFSVAAGSYSGTQSVSITDSTPGATIYCSTNGTVPVSFIPPGLIGTLTPCPPTITVSSSEVLVAVATASGYSNSGYASAQYNIASSNVPYVYSIAGNDTLGYSGDGGPALLAQFGQPHGVAVDSAGNVYVADIGDNVVRKITAGTGIISTFAGTGTYGHTGDGGPATSAELWEPNAIVIDSAGNLYIAENGDNVVRKVDASTGVISTYAGNPNGTGGTNSSATNISFGYIGALALDPSGNLYIGGESYVWKVNAGTGNASQVETNPVTYFGLIAGLALDNQNNLYVSDSIYNVVDKINTQGTLTTFAGVTTGNGQWGNGIPATSAYLSSPSGLAFDSIGNLYIADTFDFAIREINTNGIINTIAGAFQNPYTVSGDGSPATSVGLTYPQYIALDGAGNIYLSDFGHNGVRKINAAAPPPTQTAAAPAFSIAAGAYPDTQTVTLNDSTPGAKIYVAFNGSPATAGSEGYHGPISVTGSVTIQAAAVGPGYLPSSATTATYTITTPPTALISTIAGSANSYGFSGSGGPATSAQFEQPQAVAFDSAGNLYIADSSNNVVWMVTSGTQIITIVAGNGTAGFSGDSGQATAAELQEPSGVVVDKAGNLYIADNGNGRIRMVATGTGIITTIAGPGSFNVIGDGGPATSASIGGAYGLAIDNMNNLYIADFGYYRIRKIDLGTGIITTVAGGGASSSIFQEGMAATDAYLQPLDVTVDSAGNLYFPESFSARILKLSASNGTLTTVAGNGTESTIDNDGGLASQTPIIPARGIAVDTAGNVYFSTDNAAVRKVDASTGIITTTAGNYYFGYGGDGGAAAMAGLDSPEGLALDASGSLYIADADNVVVREVTFPPPAATPTFSLPAGAYTGAQTIGISDATPNSTIYYTTDGSTPSTGSSVYSKSLTLTSSGTLQAIAVTSNYTESAVASASYTITMLTPTIQLTASANSSFASNAVTFTATVSSTSGSPSGTVAFLDGTTQLGTGTLSDGSATYTTSSLASGAHSITAVYSGDTTFIGVTSAVLNETIDDFTIAPPSGGSTSATVSPGSTATYTLAVAPPAGATTPTAIAFSISGLPAGATATFSPASVPAGSGATNVTLSVAVPAQTGAVAPVHSPLSGEALPMALGLILLPLTALRRNRRLLTRTLVLFAVCVGSAIGLAALSGCGGGSNSGGGGSQPQSQTYNLTVTATAGSLTHTTQLTLTVN